MKRDWDKIINECMCELYANAEPKADFNQLIKFAKDNNVVDEKGRLIIHFEDYEIDDDKFKSILDSYVKKYKIKDPYLFGFTATICLGASPKTKLNE